MSAGGGPTEPVLVVRRSSGGAVLLGALGLALITSVAAFLLYYGGEGHGWALPLLFLGTGLGLALIVFAAAVALRTAPVFSVDAAGISMPHGFFGLSRFDWSDIAAWGITSRRLPLFPLVRMKVFAVWLSDAATARLPRSVQGEIDLNRWVVRADLIVSDWFVPEGFEAMALACRTLKPELERRP